MNVFSKLPFHIFAIGWMLSNASVANPSSSLRRVIRFPKLQKFPKAQVCSQGALLMI